MSKVDKPIEERNAEIFGKKHKVIDLSVPIAENVPSWYSYGQPFLKVLLNWFDGIRGPEPFYTLMKILFSSMKR